MTAQQSFLERVRRIHRELGIPEDYVQNSPLPLCVEAEQLVDTEADYYGRPQRLEAEAFSAWSAMKQAAAETGVILHLISAYRDLDYQRGVIVRKLDQGQVITDILRVNAAPGFSEHHTGRAIDIGTVNCPALEEEFENTDAFQWLKAHAKAYGFELSYPRNNEFGIAYEPWHWCFKKAGQA